MPNINIVDARGRFTKSLVQVYQDQPNPTGFLRSFFRTSEDASLEISIEVQRGTEKVAPDVFRGSQGERNTMDKFTEKIIIPPYYRQYFDATSLTFYDKMFTPSGSGGQVDDVTFASWVATVARKLIPLRNKIERAYELQCAQVFMSGVVQLASALNIDFQRKPGSIVDKGAGNYWTDAGIDVLADLEAGCEFIRTEGLAEGGEYNVIMGGAALRAMLNNDTFQEKGDLRRVDLVTIDPAQRDATGATFHGTVSAGAYIVRIWSYPQFYQNSAGAKVPYIDQDKIVILPQSPTFNLAFAGVPKIVRDPRNVEFPEFITPVQGAFVVGNYIDAVAESHIFDIKSAGVAIPTSVDQIYTLKVVA